MLFHADPKMQFREVWPAKGPSRIFQIFWLCDNTAFVLEHGVKDSVGTIKKFWLAGCEHNYEEDVNSTPRFRILVCTKCGHIDATSR